jgi:hypothetical protein
MTTIPEWSFGGQQSPGTNDNWIVNAVTKAPVLIDEEPRQYAGKRIGMASEASLWNQSSKHNDSRPAIRIWDSILQRLRTVNGGIDHCITALWKSTHSVAGIGS